MISVEEALLGAVAEQARAHKMADSQESLKIVGVEGVEDWDDLVNRLATAATKAEEQGAATDAFALHSLVMFLGGIRMGREIEKEAQQRVPEDDS